jgi:hypothetical protein
VIRSPRKAIAAAERSTPRKARDPGARRAISAPKATTKHASVPSNMADTVASMWLRPTPMAA